MSIAHTFFDHVRAAPHKLAVCCEDESLTYEELATLAARLSTGMASRGVKRGDHVGVILPNCTAFVAVMLAAADLGAVLVPVSITLPPAAVHSAFVAADVRHVVATSAALQGLLARDAPDFAFVDGVWVARDEQVAHAVAFNEVVKSVPHDVEPLLLAHDDDPFILTLTSGSTGDPKPIVLTQRTKLNRVAAACELYGVTLQDRTLAATPLYHSLAQRLVVLPLVTGGTSVVAARFAPSQWLACVNHHKITFTIAVSSQLAQIAQHLSEHGGAAKSLRCVVSSSALLDTPTKQRLREGLSCDFHECYGASEIAIATNLDPEAAATKLSSVGVAAPGVDVKILDEHDNVAKAGQAGEIVCSTPMLFAGYYKRPGLTEQAMWGEYFRTGDIGVQDEQGFLYFLGRKKEIIITGGINVYPADVEGVLAAHPGVEECAVFAVPDDRLGEMVVAAIVLGHGSVYDQRSLRLWCAQRLADFQQPRRYVVLDELPKNAMGKTMRRVLVERFGTARDSGDSNDRML